MYNKVDTNMNFVDREKETEKFWRENDIFKKSMENRKEGETYTFYDGPPTANGKPHIGHVETRTIKDMIPRFQTMKGKYVPRKAGWDTHGLPVEIEVEKLLGLDGKDQTIPVNLCDFKIHFQFFCYVFCDKNIITIHIGTIRCHHCSIGIILLQPVKRCIIC